VQSQNLVSHPTENTFAKFGFLVIYHTSFFIFVTTIGLNIIFGIIVDTFSELRNLKARANETLLHYVHEVDAQGGTRHLPPPRRRTRQLLSGRRGCARGQMSASVSQQQQQWWWAVCLSVVAQLSSVVGQGPDLPNILRQSYDDLTIMTNLRSTYDRRLIQKTSWEGRKASLGYNSLAKS